jgi:hypothetical protein
MAYILTTAVCECIIRITYFNNPKVLTGRSRAYLPSENGSHRLRVPRRKGHPNVVREPPE